MMSHDEIDAAIREIVAGFHVRLTEASEAIWRRKLPGMTKAEFDIVVNDLIDRRIGLPSPNEFFTLVRTRKQRRADEARHGPFLSLDEPDLTPPDTVAERVAAIREQMRSLGVQ